MSNDGSLVGNVTDSLRLRIEDLPAGAPLGPKAALGAEFGVSDIVIRKVIDLLARDGLVESRNGKSGGLYVWKPTRTPRLTDGRYISYPGGADKTKPSGPTDFDQVAIGQKPGRNTYAAQRVPAPAPIAKRLGVLIADPVVNVHYAFRNENGDVTQISTSWEPGFVIGTPGEVVGSGDKLYGGDVISRMNALGYKVTHVIEGTVARSATSAEAELLGVAIGTPVLAIERTHYAGEVAVETCDIVAPGYRVLRVDEITVQEAEQA